MVPYGLLVGQVLASFPEKETLKYYVSPATGALEAEEAVLGRRHDEQTQVKEGMQERHGRVMFARSFGLVEHSRRLQVDLTGFSGIPAGVHRHTPLSLCREATQRIRVRTHCWKEKVGNSRQP